MPETTAPAAPREKGPLDDLLASLKPSNSASVTTAVKRLADKKQTENDAKIEEKLEKGLGIFQKARSALGKLKESPDVPGSFGLNKEVIIPAGFSTAKLKEIDEATTWLVKVAEAMNAALKQDAPDFKLLDDVLAKAGGKDKDQK